MGKFTVTLSEKQAKFLWAILETHARVCEAESAKICSAIKKKLEEQFRRVGGRADG